MGSISIILPLPLKDGSILAVVTEADNAIRFWDLESNSVIRTLEGHTMPIQSLLYIEDFEIFVSVGISNIIFWNIDKS